MKKILLFPLILIALSITLFPQPKNVTDIFNKYRGKEGFTSIDLTDPSAMFSEVTIKGEKQQLKNILEKTKGIKILSYSKKDKSTGLGKEFENDLKNILPIEGYKEFLSVNEDGKLVKMMNKKGNKDESNEFLLIVAGDEESVLIWIQGNITPNDLDKLDKIFK